MDYLKPIQEKLRNKKANLPSIVASVVIINSPNIIREVQNRWLIGESAVDGFIGEYSLSPMGQEYKSYKMSLNPRADGHVDLTLTGALSEGLTVKQQSKDSFLVYSTDSKYKKIGNKYGFEEFGLTDLEWHEMQEQMLMVVLDSILNQTYINA